MIRNLIPRRINTHVNGPFAVNFDGVDQYMTYTPWTPSGTDYSLQIDINPSAVNQQQYLLSEVSTGSANWSLRIRADNRFRFDYITNLAAPNNITHNQTAKLGVWTTIRIEVRGQNLRFTANNETVTRNDVGTPVTWGTAAATYIPLTDYYNGDMIDLQLTDLDDLNNSHLYLMNEREGTSVFDIMRRKTGTLFNGATRVDRQSEFNNGEKEAMDVIWNSKQPVVVPSGQTVKLWEDGNRINGTQYRFSSIGAGTCTVQPVVAGSSAHVSYDIANDSINLDLANATNFEFTATGGDAEVSAFVLR